MRFINLYRSPSGDEDTGGGAAETITVDGKDYPVDEIKSLLAKSQDLTDREVALDEATKTIQPFLKALSEDPDEAQRQMEVLIGQARENVEEGGTKEDRKVLKQLEETQAQMAMMQLDSEIKDMKAKSDEFPHFANHVQDVLKFCSEHEIANLEAGYFAWEGKNRKMLTQETEKKTRKIDATTLNRGAGVRTQAGGDEKMRSGETMYGFLKRTGVVTA